MRKRRVMIFDDERIILSMMRYYFNVRGGYEVFTYDSPQICPIWKQDTDCSRRAPCADIVIADLMMPKMTGVELFKAQARRGCRVPVKHKMLMSGFFDKLNSKDVLELGCAVFEKPIDFNRLSIWLLSCEMNMDLSTPLGVQRHDARIPSSSAVVCMIPPNNDYLTGIAVNMSQSGLCLQTEKSISRGKIVFIKPDTIQPFRRAAIRWVKEIKQGLWNTGMQYV
jgi:CheY-like chemotaxis protein